MSSAPQKKSGGNKTVIKELEKKLKGRHHTTDTKFTTFLDRDKQAGKGLTEKQIINENMLQARARWLALNKDGDESISSGSSSIAETTDKRNFVQSCDVAKRNRIDTNARVDDYTRAENSKRAYSNSFPKTQQRLIAPPPKKNPPVLDRVKHNYQTHSEAVSLTSSPILQHHKEFGGEKQVKMKQIAPATSKSTAVKKLFGFKRGKGNKNPKNSPKFKDITTSELKEKQILSNGVKHQILGSNSSLDEDSGTDISPPITVRSLGYQNVFDDPQFSRYHKPPEDRSMTESPSDQMKQVKKPKPLPRKSFGDISQNSTGSQELEVGTLNTFYPISPLAFSPIQISPNSANSESSIPVFNTTLPTRNRSCDFNRPESYSSIDAVDMNDFIGSEKEDSVSGYHEDFKKPLGKTTSCNPVGEGWVPIRRQSTEQKMLRRGVCSDGDQDDICDDYIKMASVSFLNLTNSVNKESAFVGEGLTDINRLSTAYLKIITDRVSSSESGHHPNRDPDSSSIMESSNEIKIPTHRGLHEENTDPSLIVSSTQGDDGLSQSLPLNIMTKTQLQESSTPPSQVYIQEEEEEDTSKLTTAGQKQPQRKFQYMPVLVEKKGNKKQAPSVPKKFKYQTVTLNEEGKNSTIKELETVDVEASLNPGSLLGATKQNSSKEDYEVAFSPNGEHPLLNLSSDATQLSFHKGERSYYVNRQSLIVLENSKNLPSTMLSTTDPITGKVIWHEYVEIDEEDIDKMASSVGVAKSVPIPEKLSMLLSFRKRPTDQRETIKGDMDEVEKPGNLDTPVELPCCDDETELSRSSSTSSDCKYVFNLNDPPTVPPRPDNLDVLVDQLKERTSGDYSYAVIPGINIFEKHWMKFLQKNKIRTLLSSSGQFCPNIDQPNSKSKQQKPSLNASESAPQLTPPSVPPRTDSLLREQELIFSQANQKLQSGPESFIFPPIIVKTKKEKKRLLSKASLQNIVSPQEKEGEATFISYIKDDKNKKVTKNAHVNNIARPKKHGSPPKPIPYEEHRRKQKLQTVPSFLDLVASSTAKTSSVGVPLNVKLNTDYSFKRKSPAKPLGKDRGRPIGHKKLARQKSHFKGSHQTSTRLRQTALPVYAPGGQRWKKPLGPRADVAMRIKRDSLAFLMKNRDILSTQLLTSAAAQKQTKKEIGTRLEQHGMKMSVGSDATSNRDLADIMVELGRMLKSNQFTEDDLLSAMEGHLKVNLRKDSTQTNESHDSSDEITDKLAVEDDSSSHEGQSSAGIPDDVDTLLCGVETSTKQEIDSESKPSYVNLKLSENPSLGGIETSTKQEMDSENKPSYVNLKLSENPSLGGIETSTKQEINSENKPSYVNLMLSSLGGVETSTKQEMDSASYVNLKFSENMLPPEIANDSRQSDHNKQTNSQSCVEMNMKQEIEPRSSYINLELSGDILPPEIVEDKRFLLSKRSEDRESPTHIPCTLNPLSTPMISIDNNENSEQTLTPSTQTESTDSSAKVSRTRCKTSVHQFSHKPNLSVHGLRQERTLSNPNSEEMKLPTTPKSRDKDFFSPTGEKIKNDSQDPRQKDRGKQLHKRGSIDTINLSEGNTLSYNLALQMEESRFLETVSTQRAHKTRVTDRKEDDEEKRIDQERILSEDRKALQRSNLLAAKQHKTSAPCINGLGIFTCRGGTLTNEGSGITIEIPENAVPRGKSQKIWFEVIQTVYNPLKQFEISGNSRSFKLVESLIQEKKDKNIQLSPMIVVHPFNAVLEQSIVIRMPHCLPYRNNSWHLQMLGRTSDKDGDDWAEIMNTIGLVEVPQKSNSKFRNRSSYQMHIDYVQVKTSQLGCFKLVGRPIRNGTYAAKKMVASVYSKTNPHHKSVQFDIFANNAIEDQSNALNKCLSLHGHTPLVRNMPILCFGDGKDMEITLSNDSNCAIPLGTKAIPFGLFWRQNKVGQSHVTFNIETELVEDDRTLTLKIQQAGSKLYHETNFLIDI